MGIFTSKDELAFFEVSEGVAAPDWSLEAGQILEVAGAVPRELSDLERGGFVRRLPDPGELLPWLRAIVRFRPIGEATFRARPEPPEPTYLDEPTLLSRMGWTRQQLEAAQVRLGFPRHAKGRERFVENVGFQTVSLWYLEDAVQKWQRELPRDLLVGAGR